MITTPQLCTRRHFMRSGSLSIGSVALAGLLENDARATMLPDFRRIAPRAKRVIYLFQSGGPSQLDLYDYKPGLRQLHGSDLPESVRGNQRLTGFTKNQKSLPVAASKFRFRQHGTSGQWLTELLPNLGRVADELCIVRSVTSDAINHEPARMFIQTGSVLAGRPSMGSWIWYGLGSECRNLPAFMVLTSRGSCKRTPQPVTNRLWESGFIPSQYQGVKLQSVGDPILYVGNPKGIDRGVQNTTINALSQLNGLREQVVGDPEINARIQQYEMAFEMQASVPSLTDIRDEPKETFELYGEDAKKRGTFAANCLLARRMAERGVRFIQLYHVGWDHHQNIPRDLPLMCGDIDRPTYALIADLKRRGLLDDTLVICGGEFGRTSFCQGTMTKEVYGRDHHPRCFTMWMAGGGIKGGLTYGATDDFSYNVAENPVHIHDLQATILHLLGIDHTRLTYRYQGREFRLTDVHGDVVTPILA